MNQFMFMQKKGEFESKSEFYIVDGKISKIKITNISGARPLKKKISKISIFFLRYTLTK